ncbi:apolipoprotein A1/A4/E family protein [Microbacterium sp. EST19A]|uniref:apolipoprotein A1/A4/E family protein n=1 Tax=Microbacterium sp. EST19A TaxID=2862681 RepID=UPI001CBC8217|nr:apolipoprotein A1/A4/E family protein [Microbacterium sp. EST19A]
MSIETLTIVLSAVGIVLTLGASLFTGFTWVVRHVDDRIYAVEEKLTTRIDAVEEKLTTRIDAVEEKLTTRIDAVEERLTTRIDAVDLKLATRIDSLAVEVVDVKIAIARLEGPPRQLATASR